MGDWLMRNEWRGLCYHLGVRGSVDEFYDALCKYYSEPHRAYHTLEHIKDCFRRLLISYSREANLSALQFALWYHDAIYDIGARNNEERSAELARHDALKMRLGDGFADRVGMLILATKHEVLPTADDAKLIVDLDLFSLSLPRSEFERNSQLIRREYAAISDDVFRDGRMQFLRAFLAREYIYCTEEFRLRHEIQAQANLRRELHELENPTRG